jgi:wyosine [tRNA(Phe)-imidazoG37] synthetase (radical SAM superfamily)
MQSATLLPVLDHLVYGPVNSRRLGRSLGVNVFPAGRKICSFNCAYCQYGWTREGEGALKWEEWPSPAEIALAVRTALARIAETCGTVDRITLAGNGEPTLHPALGEIVERLRTVRDQVMPKARLAILSNASTLERPGVAAALRRLDEAYLKLDTADPAIFRRLNGSRANLSAIVDRLGTIPNVTIQALFTRDPARRIDNTSAEAIDGWLGALRRIRPTAVHVYSLDRTPAWSDLETVDRPELEEIAERVRAAGLEARVF